MQERLYLNQCFEGTHENLKIFVEFNSEVEDLIDTLENYASTTGEVILENEHGKQITQGFVVFFFPDGVDYDFDDFWWCDECGDSISESEYYDFVGYSKKATKKDIALWTAYKNVIDYALEGVEKTVSEFIKGLKQ